MNTIINNIINKFNPRKLFIAAIIIVVVDYFALQLFLGPLFKQFIPNIQNKPNLLKDTINDYVNKILPYMKKINELKYQKQNVYELDDDPDYDDRDNDTPFKKRYYVHNQYISFENQEILYEEAKIISNKK